MNNRWLGGTLTNWKTVSGSIARLRELDESALPPGDVFWLPRAVGGWLLEHA